MRLSIGSIVDMESGSLESNSDTICFMLYFTGVYVYLLFSIWCRSWEWSKYATSTYEFFQVQVVVAFTSVGAKLTKFWFQTLVFF